MGIPLMTIKFLKIENDLILHPIMMTSLWGVIKTKKLPPEGEATHNTTNISYLVKFKTLFTPILFHI